MGSTRGAQGAATQAAPELRVGDLGPPPSQRRDQSLQSHGGGEHAIDMLALAGAYLARQPLQQRGMGAAQQRGLLLLQLREGFQQRLRVAQR